jgi:hypothetical protein
MRFDEWLAGLPLRCTRGRGGVGQDTGALFQLTIAVHSIIMATSRTTLSL